MASFLFNRGKFLLGTGGVVWGTTDVRVLLVTSGYTFDADHATVSQITNELSGGGYVRKTTAGGVATQNNTNDRVEYDMNDIVWTALGAAAGNPVAAIVYKYNASDASAELIAKIDLTSPPIPNGGDVTVQWGAYLMALS